MVMGAGSKPKGSKQFKAMRKFQIMKSINRRRAERLVRGHFKKEEKFVKEYIHSSQLDESNVASVVFEAYGLLPYQMNIGLTELYDALIADTTAIHGEVFDVLFSLEREELLLEKMQERAYIKEISQNTREDINQAITKSIKKGESIQDAVDNVIKTKYKGYKKWRTKMIARTETKATYDTVTIDLFKESNYKYLDVLGCIHVEDHINCGRAKIPIDEAQSLQFHPNCNGGFFPRTTS